jgi:hypothetical protein
MNEIQMFLGDNLEIYVSGFVVVGGLIAYLFSKKQRKITTDVPTEAQLPGAAPVEVVVPKISWSQRLTLGLDKSRSEVWGKIGNLFAGN